MLNGNYLSINGGWSGFQTTDNDEWCVDYLEPLNKQVSQETVTLNELQNFINEKNELNFNAPERHP